MCMYCIVLRLYWFICTLKQHLKIRNSMLASNFVQGVNVSPARLRAFCKKLIMLIMFVIYLWLYNCSQCLLSLQSSWDRHSSTYTYTNGRKTGSDGKRNEKGKKWEKKDNILCQCLAGTESCTAVLILVIFCCQIKKRWRCKSSASHAFRPKRKRPPVAASVSRTDTHSCTGGLVIPLLTHSLTDSSVFAWVAHTRTNCSL